MRNRLSALIDVKSLVTLTLTAGFVVLSATDRISPEQFLTVFTTVISFYFGTQYRKNTADKKGEN